MDLAAVAPESERNEGGPKAQTHTLRNISIWNWENKRDIQRKEKHTDTLKAERDIPKAGEGGEMFGSKFHGGKEAPRRRFSKVEIFSILKNNTEAGRELWEENRRGEGERGELPEGVEFSQIKHQTVKSEPIKFVLSPRHTPGPRINQSFFGKQIKFELIMKFEFV